MNGYRLKNHLSGKMARSPFAEGDGNKQLSEEALSRKPEEHALRVYFSLFGEGYGHSSRALSIAQNLDIERDLIVMGCHGYALDRIKKASLHRVAKAGLDPAKHPGYITEHIQPETQFYGKNGSFEIGTTILKNWKLPFSAKQRIAAERDIIRKYNINCVVADCRSSVVYAAYELGIPTIYITNQTDWAGFFTKQASDQDGQSNRNAGYNNHMRFTERLSGLIGKMMARMSERCMSTFFEMVDEILLPDLAPPYTVCLPILSRNPKIRKLQTFVGPLTQWKETEVVARERPATGPYLVASFGGHAYRKPLFDALLRAARLLPHVHFDIMTTFSCDNKPENVQIIEFAPDIERYMKAADLCIGPAGHSNLMELVTLGKPAILVPDRNQSEQESNARTLVKLGCATQIEHPDLSGELLAKQITNHLTDPQYAINAEKLKQLSAQPHPGSPLNGAEIAARLIRERAGRMTAYFD